MKRAIYTIYLAVIFCSCVKQRTEEDKADNDNDHLLLGNPSNAAVSRDSSRNYLMTKSYYTLSYDSARGIPNWVSWHLSAADLNTTERSNSFRSDTLLPAGWYRVTDFSYKGSGFDRGHNCPSGDRTVSIVANTSTYLMSNIIPQAPNNNEYTWARMEDSIRYWIRGGKEAFIQMGSYGMGGTGDSGYVTRIDKGRVVVPAYIWKLVVLIPDGNNDLKRIDQSARVIAVIIPNNNSISRNWKMYRTTAAVIQVATGYTLMRNISAPIRSALLNKVDAL